jgi:3-dehydroquinate dehydratase-1
MNSIKVRGLEIGTGCPKVCVSITGKTEEEIIESAKQIVDQQVDLVEWRADWFEGLEEEKRVSDLLIRLREVLQELPLLFTIRTKQEGGESLIPSELYAEINQKVAKTRFVDMIDIEVFHEGFNHAELVRDLKKEEMIIVGSNHDFDKTPEKNEIIRRLCYMQNVECDILKIAVMPKCKHDVITLLSATEEMVRLYARKPVVTMSMGDVGMISRISGGTFGSSITFGAIGKTSAPGQIEVSRLQSILDTLYRNM